MAVEGTLVLRMRYNGAPAVAGLTRTQAAIQRVRASIASIGRTLLPLLGAAGIILLTSQFIKMGVAAEAALTKVATLADFTTGEIDAMRIGTKRLQAQFGVSFGEISKARFDVVSSGFAKISAQQEILAGAFKLGAANATDFLTATKVLTSIMAAFGRGAEQTSITMDELTVIARNSKASLQEIGPALAKIAPAANLAGQSLAQTGAALDILTLAGFSADEGATRIGRALDALTKPSVQKALAKQGVAVRDKVTKEFRTLNDVLRDLRGTAPEALSTLFPNVRARQGFAVLLKSIDAFEDKLRSITGDELANATERAFEKTRRTAEFQFGRLAEAFKAKFTAAADEGIIGALATAAEKWADLLTVSGDEVSQLNDQLIKMQARYDRIGTILRGLDAEQVERRKELEVEQNVLNAELVTLNKQLNVEKKIAETRAAQPTFTPEEIKDLEDVAAKQEAAEEAEKKLAAKRKTARLAAERKILSDLKGPFAAAQLDLDRDVANLRELGLKTLAAERLRTGQAALDEQIAADKKKKEETAAKELEAERKKNDKLIEEQKRFRIEMLKAEGEFKKAARLEQELDAERILEKAEELGIALSEEQAKALAAAGKVSEGATVADELAGAFSPALAGAITNVFAAIGAGEDINLEAALGGIMSALGQSMIALGTSAILAGTLGTVAPIFAPETGGPAGLAAGIALVAFGGGLVAGGAALSKGGGGGGRGVSNPAGSAAEGTAGIPSGPGIGRNRRGDRGQGDVTVIISGNQILDENKFGEQVLRPMLLNLFERGVVRVSDLA